MSVPNSKSKTHAVMQWTNDDNKVSVHHLRHIDDPKKALDDYEVGDTGNATYPGFPGKWEFLILAVGESKSEMDFWLKEGGGSNKRKASVQTKDKATTPVAEKKATTPVAEKKKKKNPKSDVSKALNAEVSSEQAIQVLTMRRGSGQTSPTVIPVIKAVTSTERTNTSMPELPTTPKTMTSPRNTLSHTPQERQYVQQPIIEQPHEYRAQQLQPYHASIHTPEVRPQPSTSHYRPRQQQLQTYETPNWYGQSFSALMDDTTEPEPEPQPPRDNSRCPCQCEDVLTRLNALESEVMQLRQQQCPVNGNIETFNGMTKEQLKSEVTGKSVTAGVKYLMLHFFSREEMLSKTITGQATANQRGQTKSSLDSRLIQIVIDIVSAVHNLPEAAIKIKIRSRIKMMRQQATEEEYVQQI